MYNISLPCIVHNLAVLHEGTPLMGKLHLQSVLGAICFSIPLALVVQLLFVDRSGVRAEREKPKFFEV